MTVPEAIIQQAIQLVRPPTPPPAPIKDIKKSPVKTLTSLSGEVTQDEAPKEVLVRGEAVKVRTLTVSDNKDAIKLALWREEANLQVHTGDYIEAKNVVVRAYQGEAQLSSTSRTSIEITTPPDEELHLTVLAISIETGPSYSLLCQIDGNVVSEFTCEKDILREMIPSDMELDEDQGLDETVFEHLPAICSVITRQKAIIAVKQKLSKINE